jgi:hypothetical protein
MIINKHQLLLYSNLLLPGIPPVSDILDPIRQPISFKGRHSNEVQR